MRAGGGLAQRLQNAAKSTLDPRIYIHGLKLLHYYNYSHVSQKRKIKMGANVAFAPNVSIINGERIEIGDSSHIGARDSLWAGNDVGRIIIGKDTLFAPDVFITASNYRTGPGLPMMHQPKDEKDVVVGDDVWLGAGVLVMPGVTIGNGCVVGAGSVVTRDLPTNSIAVGAPAKIVAERETLDSITEPSISRLQ